MRKGFSLIEIALVVGIIALLTLIAAVNYHGYYLRQLTLTTAQSIRSDLDFSLQHALTRGVANQIRYNVGQGVFVVADSSGTVKSTGIPANVQVAVSGFEKGNPAKGATADIVPAGYWIGFLPMGGTVTGQPALVVVATSATWYVISIGGATGQIAGPTQNRSEIPLSNDELSALLGGSQQGMMVQGPLQTTQSTISSGLSGVIRTAWGIP